MKPASDRSPRPLRVLVVEDDPDARFTLRKLLELQGHTVEDAGQGGGVVARVAEWRPDAAVIDIGLSDIDGYTVARQVRAAQPAPPPLLIALTGYGRDEDRRQSAEAGFDAHLVKPVRIQQLLDVLGRAAPREPS